MTSPLPPTCTPAVVKSVLSGDSLTLKHPAGMDQTVSLAYILAPRLASAKKGTADEPYAFDAREVMRRILIGKDVGVRVEYSNKDGTRDFVSIYVLHPKSGEWVNVGIVALQKGFCKLRDEGQGRTDLPIEYPLLIEAQRRAKVAEIGLWSSLTPAAIQSVQLTNPAAFVKTYKGKPVHAIIEHIRDAGSFRARIVPHPDAPTHTIAWVQISGIRAPQPARSDAIATDNEPFADEAKAFVEQRLLQREVDLLVEDVAPGANNSNAVIASVQHPVGNIAVFLVREGLARVHDWTAASVTGGPAALRAAEAAARKARAGLWALDAATNAGNGGASDNGAGTSKKFQALVVRIVGPDHLQLKPVSSTACPIRNVPVEGFRAFLTSVRPARRTEGGAPQQQQQGGGDDGWYAEAREHVRKLAIGKTVTVTLDYEKPAQDGYDARTYVSVGVPQGTQVVNLAHELISQGYATVVRPRRGEEENKAANLDDLILAEADATEKKKGMHSGKKPPAGQRLHDASETAVKAKQLLPFLERAKKSQGVVDHVINGARLRVLVPREAAKVTLVLSGVRVPGRGEPFADEALAKTLEVAGQRDVEFEVETVDKTGAFISTVWVPAPIGSAEPAVPGGGSSGSAGSRTRSLAVLLLEHGLATIHGYSAEQSAYASQLFDAEARAKAARAGVWATYDPEAEALEREAAELRLDEERSRVAEAAQVKKQLMHVCISEYVAGNHVYLQKMSAEAIASLEGLMAQFAAYHESPAAAAAPAPTPIRAGDLISARFSEDGQWYRARVRKSVKGAISVYFIDYGNAETVTAAAVRSLPAEFAKQPAQAQEARLSYIKVRPADNEYGAEAVARLRDLTEGKKLIANVDRIVGNLVYVSLFDPATAHQDTASPIGLDFSTSINVDLVAEGLAVIDIPAPVALRSNTTAVPTGPRAPAEFAEYLDEAAQEARRKHLGMWEFGDVDEETI
ncbi:hypothetical protein BC828DRAFT_403149 [Blastocladiella britannica]|nr:hypothetical protein BC828DRAFT_403149 [Blastocladiella britannica]